MSSQATILRVTAENTAGSDATSRLRQTIGRSFLNAEFDFADERPRFDCTMWNLSGIRVMTGVSSKVRICSRRSQAAEESLILAAGFGAAGLMRSRGRELPSGDGTAMLVHSGEERVAETGDGWSPRHIRLPATCIRGLVRGLDDRVMRPIRPDHPALALLGAYLPLVCRAQVLNEPLLAARAADHICDLVALAVGAEGDEAELASRRSLADVRARTIRQWVRRRLGNEGLTVADVARAHGLSTRTVQHIFHRDGTSFSAFLLAERLKRAWLLLREPARRDWSIAALAFDTGFGDLSYFNRTFRRRFGCTPSDCRVESAGAPLAP